MLSVYLDGEMPSPWREKLESHVEACPDCAGRLESYREAALGHESGEEGAALAAAGERVWERLGASVSRASPPRSRRPLWRRRVSLPIPAAAAALLAAGVAFSWAIAAAPDGGDEMPVISLVSETDLYAQAQDMASIIEYLISRGGDEMTILRLPDTQSFAASGEPAVVRAADYHRQLASWNAAQNGARGEQGSSGQGRRRLGQ
jgi:hypothetical protein